MDLDLAAFPKGDRQLWEIVDYIKDNGDRTETHYLEAKSDVDVRTKAGGVKVAKFVLGAANRMPDVAAKYFEGHALMVLGVTHGAIDGVDQIDEKDLRSRVGQYTGSGSKPGWEIRQLPIVNTNKVVLVVLVDPPEAGATIWTCRKEYSDGAKGTPLLRDGAIYVRPTSETREANAAEIAELVERARTVSLPDADLDVTISGVVHRITFRPGLRDEWIEDVRKHLSRGGAKNAGVGAGAGLFMTASLIDSRNAEQFNTELDTWAYEVKRAWAKFVLAASWMIAKPPAIQVFNRGQTFLRDVEVQVEFPQGVLGLDEPDDDDPLPEMPAARGEIPDLAIGHFHPIPSPYSPGELAGLGPESFTLENPMDDGAVAIYKLRELRPRPYAPMDALFNLIALQSTPAEVESVSGTWLLTADHHRNYSGTFEIPVKVLDITELLMRLLYDERGISRRPA
ncbi:hypothetical protein AB0H58_21620 [Nocardia neocaledoniensis]|uniref:hypothetical protein n=1 Tax=Nocardia neocaledoniensis TaxID=236511 RepID=UPI0033F48424